MGPLEHIFLAVKRLKARPFESLLMVIGVGLGTAVICGALSLLLGYMDNVKAIQESKYYTHMYISADDKNAFRASSGVVRLGEELPKPAKLKMELISEIKDACPAIEYVFIEDMDFITFGEEPMDNKGAEDWFARWQEYNLQVMATTSDYFPANELNLQEGSFFTSRDLEEGNRVIVLGVGAAQRLFQDRDPIGREVPVVGGEPFVVIGVLAPVTDSSMWQSNLGYIPITSMTRSVDEFYRITAVAPDAKVLPEAHGQVDSYLKKTLEEGYIIYSSISDLRDINRVAVKGKILAGIMASLGLFIAAMNVMNLMMARLLRRIKEIGILVALGSDSNGIFISFLCEATVIGVLGGLLGFLFSVLGQKLLSSMLTDFIFKMDFRVLLLSLGISIFVSLIFGVYPAVQASKIKTVDALRTE